jgi:hypothetical protein
MAEFDHRFDDDLIVPILTDPGDEGAVDLDRVHGQTATVDLWRPR